MALTDYRNKRSFSRTREPEGIKSLPEGNRFVVHKHWARRLHYDLRLEMGGVLKSWAVPKGPSLIPFEKRLAVNVEDHPLEYIDFKGEIPGGEYGAGTVEIWDKGQWEAVESDPLKAFKDGMIKFRLHGKKLQGLWTLVKMKREENQWLLIKDNDEANPVKSGTPVPPEAVKAQMPEDLKVQLAFPYEKPPAGDSWIYEIKYDGYRIMCFIDHGKVRLVTRNGYDWTEKFANIARHCLSLPVKSAILDGEIIAPDKNGLSSFELLQNAIGDGNESGLQYIIFDIPFYNGYSLKASPLGERKKLLARILSGSTGSPLIYSEHLTGDGGSVFSNACRLSLEGIVAKDINSAYEGKRSRAWVKVKCVKRQEFVIGGYTMPRGSRQNFGSLILGYYLDGKLLYCGKTGTGFDNRTLKSIYDRLKKIPAASSPFFNLKSMEGARWVKPVLSAEVSFLNFTSDMLLRH
ncbi:MAG: non-homologous end-joining DNA ligase [Brevinematales bacterium]|jgi:bifunctional non-homologous end joining protein LigD